MFYFRRQGEVGCYPSSLGAKAELNPGEDNSLSLGCI